MHLKRLEIVGFKSFADKTDLSFAPGITAVVGPNGSGKSNLSEAIRWVLGESSARDLRGVRMEDIIFAGSEARRQLGHAQVSITFDNGDSALKIPHAEVTITRRVDRSGASDFFINQSPCRLRDIQDLFLDTGIGKENYSFIGQGRIDQILSSRPEDRRAIIEEAAGISRYRQRKKEATSKLTDTEQNLLRLGDLMTGLQEQLVTLADQAARAREYQGLDERWRALEVGIAATALAGLWQQGADLSERNRKLQERLRQTDMELQDREAATEASRQLASGLEAEWNVVQGGLVEASAAVERADGKVALVQTQLHQVRADMSRVADEVDALGGRIAGLEEEQAGLQDRRDQGREALAAAQTELAACENRHRQAQNQLRLWTSRVEALRQQGFNLAQAAAEHRTVAAGQVRAREQAAARSRKLEQERADAAAELGRAEERVADARAEAEAAQLRGAELAARLAAARTAEQQSVALVQERTGQAARLREKLEGTRSRVALLQDLKAEFEGYQKGPRTVLQARERGAAWAKGIYGAVAELVRSSAAHERAIEVSLGGAAQHIITADEATARGAIQELKRSDAGRATFLPLDVVRAGSISAQERSELQGLPGVVGVALDLVQFEAHLGPAMAHLLGRVVVCREMEGAVAVGRRTGFRYRIVTLDGELIAPGGAITGGSWGGRGTGLISRERQREELIQELTRLEEQLQAAQVAAAAAVRERAAAEQRCREIQEALGSAQVAHAQAKGAVEKAEAAALHWQQNLGVLLSEVEALAVESVSDQEEETRHLVEAEALVNRQKGLDAELAATAAHRDAAEAEVASSNGQVTDRRIQLAELAQVERAEEQQVERLVAELQAVCADVAQRQQSLRDLMERENAGVEEMAALEEAADAARTERHRLADAVADLHRRRLAALEQGQTHERHLKGLRRIQSEATAQLQTAELDSARLQMEVQAIEQRCRETLGVDTEALAGQELPAAELAQAREQATALRAEMDALGPVYLGAIAEHTAAQERWDFLEAQKGDLEEAKAALYRAIAELDRRIRAQFLAGFEEVRRAFQHVFRELFEGGKADLVLLAPDNLLETGIEILVQPPGKKMTPLGLLSGGERALCATALLFALLRVRPSPFVLLDEVEAALDEANVTRFGRYLRRMAGTSQFICITHQRASMESADALYGVTMEGGGVSRVVSVRFADVVPTAS